MYVSDYTYKNAATYAIPPNIFACGKCQQFMNNERCRSSLKNLSTSKT